MKLIWIYLYTIFIFVSVTTERETEVSDEKKCNSNLSLYHVTTSFGPKVICAYISPQKLNWNDAKFRCNLLFAQLIDKVHFKSELRIDLLFKGIDILWVGIRRTNDFFVTEYPSKLFREVDSFSPDYWGYHWFDGEPGAEDCVALNVSDGSLKTHSCGDILPFICEDGGRNISTIQESLACPAGYNLSFPLSSSGRTCISLEKPHTRENAEDICMKNNGRLATFHEYNILSKNKFISPLDIENFWIKKRNSNLCEVTRNMNGHMTKTFPISCSQKYPFVCVKHYKTESIRVHLSPKSVTPVQSYSEDAADLLTCNYESQFSENLNMETDLWFQWYKDDLPLPLNSYVVRMSFIGDTLKRDPYESDIASRQGYYHCEVQLPGSNERHPSSKVKFFYSDIATYVVEIRGMKQTNDLDYSHQNFFDYMNDFDEASMSNILKKVKVRYPEADWDFMSKSILNDEAVMKIIVYIYKTGNEDFDERLACEELNDAFKELNSVPVFMERISVYINCEEFPVKNGYLQVVKGLQRIEDKLNRIEDKQEYILEKLQDFEASKNLESGRNNQEFLAEHFLEAVDDLKRYINGLRHKTPELRYSESEEDDHERNEFEDNFFSPREKELFDKSKEHMRPQNIAPRLNSDGFAEELNDYSIFYPEKEWKDSEPDRIIFQKDL